MPKQHLNPPTLFNSLQHGFSQIVVAPAGRTVYLSGQVAWDEHEQIVGPGDLRAQVWQSLRNLDTAMRAAGGSLADIVSMRLYIVQAYLSESRAVSDGLKAFFPGDRPPATTWIGVPRLANEEFLIEIEAIAVLE